MTGYVNGIDWINAEAMKYWSYAKSYKKDAKAEVKNYIFSGRYWGALKRDGYYQRFVKDEDGNMFMIARNKNVKGEAVNKIEWVPQLQPFFDSLPNGTVFIGEVYLPNNECSKNVTTILGCLKDKAIERQNKGTPLYFYIFDVMTYGGVDYTKSPFKTRIDVLADIATDYENKFKFIEFAEYFCGEELWNKIGEYLAAGNEGAVITREDCPVYFKRTPARMTIKIKKELSNTIDCFFTGAVTAPAKEYTGKEIETWKYWIDLRTGEKLEQLLYKEYSLGLPYEPITKSYFMGMAGSLEIGVVKGDKVVPIGYLSGLTEEIKLNHEKYKGACIEINAMEVMETGGLRHPKFVGFRPDLTIRDCTWEKCFGE